MEIPANKNNRKPPRTRRFFSRLVAGAALAAMPAFAPAESAPSGQPPATASQHPAGWSDKSYYLPMKDGTRIAVSLYFPGGTPPRSAPVILIQTRYGRATQFTGGAGGDPQRWRDAGYVVAVIDTRGSTASFGPRRVDLGPEQQADVDEIVAHLASQPWSNGQVIAYGLSYMADTADAATARAAPALIGAVVREVDFDVYRHLLVPGGVANDLFLNLWSERTLEIDLGRTDQVDCRARVEDCPKLFPYLQPVDEDPDYRLLRQALAGKQRWTAKDYANTPFRDDPGGNGYSLFGSSPAAQIDNIRGRRKPVLHWGSWMDGSTAAAALERYASTPRLPAEVWITSNDHPHLERADPFLPDVRAPLPGEDQQFAIIRDFAERLRSDAPIVRRIHYHVMGTEIFKETSVWPPADARPLSLNFAVGNRLSDRPSLGGVDRYAVDFSATTGARTRWSTQLEVSPAYPDRRQEDKKLLTYTGMPVDRDLEVVGTPVVTLHVATATADPAFFVYLEDVAPDGRVTLISDGQLRAVNRKPANPASLPYNQGPAPHSFRRADALPVVPGKVMEVRFALQPAAALIRKGHRLRIAIAGADKDTFRRYSEGKPDSFAVHYGQARPSRIELTVRDWRE
jgi:putative CocE/NonD family hydrolase